MKSKITRGAGFCGLIDYVYNIGPKATEDKDAQRIGGNMSGGNPRALVAEFAALRRLRPDIKRPVWHSSLRLPAGETISDQKWNDIVQDYMARMGINSDHHPYIVVKHDDSHVHIVSSRIRLDGSLYYGQNEHLIATRITQQLEKDYGLNLTKGPTYGEDGKIVRSDRATLSSKEQKMAERTGNIAPRQRLQGIISDSVKDRPTQATFEKRLTEAGVSYRAGSNGYSYQLDGIAFKGSQLGQAFKWAQIQKFIILPEQEIKTEEHFRPQINAEDHTNLLNQKSVYAVRAATWKAEQKRRDKYRANCSIINSVGKLSADILPQPLREAVMIAIETMIIIARINDWRQVHVYRLQVERLKDRMNQVKAERVKVAEKLACQNNQTYQQSEYVALGPKQTALIILNMACRIADKEIQAKLNKLANRVCELPADAIIYRGPKKFYLEGIIKAAFIATNAERQQEISVQNDNVLGSNVPSQTSSHIKQDKSNAPRCRRR